MAPDEFVPEADRLEQEAPAGRDERDIRPIPPDAPDADAFEQELPIVHHRETVGFDADRTEPVSDDDWGTTS